MKRSRRTPARFMATPWIPVGRPKRKSSLMTVKSGRQRIPRSKTTTHPPPHRRHMAYPATIHPEATLPMAAPVVPKAGTGPSPAMRITLRTMFSTVITTPMRSGVWASPAERSAPLSMKNIRLPKAKTNRMRR